MLYICYRAPLVVNNPNLPSTLTYRPNLKLLRLLLDSYSLVCTRCTLLNKLPLVVHIVPTLIVWVDASPVATADLDHLEGLFVGCVWEILRHKVGQSFRQQDFPQESLVVELECGLVVIFALVKEDLQDRMDNTDTLVAVAIPEVSMLFERTRIQTNSLCSADKIVVAPNTCSLPVSPQLLD